MKNRINIAELLKDCPRGMELDCVMYEDCRFLDVDTKGNSYLIRITTPCGIKYLDKYGCYTTDNKAKCIIFPKGKTSWEGFHRPFKDGDIVYNRLQKRICIYHHVEDKISCINYCRYNEDHKTFEILHDYIYIAEQDYRLATEKEKAKLFDVIKANGYKWNVDTKTLEKAAKLIFNNGDIVATTSGAWLGITTGGESGELIPTHCVIKSNGVFEAYTDVKKTWCFSRFATKEERQKLFDEIKAHGYIWNSETKTLEKLVIPEFKVGDKITNGKTSITIGYIDDEYYYEVGRDTVTRLFIKNQDEWNLIPKRFDVTTLKPFESKVLVRHNKDNKWTGSFFSFIDRDLHSHCYKFVTTADKSYPMMIPFKGNEYLLGKTDDCQDFYKIWE